MYTSNFGISNNIADMNGDGLNDIVRMTSNGPYHIGIAYNDPLNVGFFNQYDEVYTLSAYHSQIGDLDGDGNVGINDFLAAWGPNPGHPADFDGDDVVGILDFLALLASWGPCP